MLAEEPKNLEHHENGVRIGNVTMSGGGYFMCRVKQGESVESQTIRIDDLYSRDVKNTTHSGEVQEEIHDLPPLPVPTCFDKPLQASSHRRNQRARTKAEEDISHTIADTSVSYTYVDHAIRSPTKWSIPISSEEPYTRAMKNNMTSQGIPLFEQDEPKCTSAHAHFSENST